MSRTRLRARADRVNQECDLGDLLQGYGYGVVPDRQREQQFSCDLHGMDNKPSARLYGYNNTTYCWVCQKKRDAISYVMEKEHLNFRDAIEQLGGERVIAQTHCVNNLKHISRNPVTFNLAGTAELLAKEIESCST